jgi:FlaA1/EpsC-like NDP-sugar epimerase
MTINNTQFKSSQRLWRSIYISFDFFIGGLAYTFLYSYRKSVIEPARFGLETMHWDDFYILGALITSFLWLFSMGMIGLYANPIRKSRLNELSRAIQLCFVFSLIYFLLFLLNDYVKSYSDYFRTAGVFFLTLFIGTLMTRLIFGYIIQRRIINGKYFFPTLLIGSRIELKKT